VSCGVASFSFFSPSHLKEEKKEKENFSWVCCGIFIFFLPLLPWVLEKKREGGVCDTIRRNQECDGHWRSPSLLLGITLSLFFLSRLLFPSNSLPGT
jgi:hypothetical protein